MALADASRLDLAKYDSKGLRESKQVSIIFGQFWEAALDYVALNPNEKAWALP